MYLHKVFHIYDRIFSWKRRISSTIERNKLILIPLAFIILSTITFYVLFFLNVSNKIYWMPICIGIFILSVSVGGLINRKSLKKDYGSLTGYEEELADEFYKYIDVDLRIREMEQYKLLIELIEKEIEEIKESKKFPFLNTIRQLSIAVLITGLLSYSFSQISSGNIEQGIQLILIYILIIGSIIILGTIVYNSRDMTRIYKLKEIDKLLVQLQLIKLIAKE